MHAPLLSPHGSTPRELPASALRRTWITSGFDQVISEAKLAPHSR
jgi:hypothetical protein